jgi:hypothetical protein
LPENKAVSLRSLFRPIAEAPIEKGKPYGPCLLIPGRNGSPLGFGEYDGEGWHDFDHGQLNPTDYVLVDF